jgi:hypothetical protein
MPPAELIPSAAIEQLPCTRKFTVETELNRILTQARESCPSDARISFDFDGHLHIHVDVRTLQQVAEVQAALASSGGGLFHTFTRGNTPHHPFFHRLSARINA